MALAGPGATTDYDFKTGTLILEQKIADNFNVELAVNAQSEFRIWNRPLTWDYIGIQFDPNMYRRMEV